MLIADKITTDISALREVSSPFSAEEMEKFPKESIRKMLEIMATNGGAGLAGPQVGLFKRIFIANFGENPEICINPRIVSQMPFYEKTAEEGCLSLPGRRFMISRPAIIRVRFVNDAGAVIERDLTDWAARVFQHENDHLDGIVASDRGSEVFSLDED